MSRLPVLPDAAHPLIFGHRGLPSRAPENTMSSFRAAVAGGVPGIELDVRLTDDGRLAVIHDSWTGRVAPEQTPKGRGLPVERTPWARLAALDVGSWRGLEWRGERMPLLEEVLEEFGEGVYFDIEMKSSRVRSRGLERALTKALRAARDAGRLAKGCIVSSFNPLVLARFKAVAPEFPTAIIWSAERSVPFFLRHGEGRWLGGADCLKPEQSLHGGAAASRWERSRWLRIAWTVDDLEAARRLGAEGCGGFISNRADELLPLLSDRLS